MKYTEEMKAKIYELIACGKWTDRDVCKQVGISHDTFITWKNEKSEFSELVKDAVKARMESYANMARSGLAKLLDVYEYKEVTTEWRNIKVVSEEIVGDKKVKRIEYVPTQMLDKKVTKVIMPNVTAVMYALNNAEAESWKHKEHKEIKHEGGFNVSSTPFKLVPRKRRPDPVPTDQTENPEA